MYPGRRDIYVKSNTWICKYWIYLDIFGSVNSRFMRQSLSDLKPINLHYIVMNWTGCCTFLWKAQCAVRVAHRILRWSQLCIQFSLCFSILLERLSYPHHSTLTLPGTASGLSGDAEGFFRGSCLLFFKIVHLHQSYEKSRLMMN